MASMSISADTLSIREAAARLGCSHQTLYRAAKKTGAIAPGVRVFKIGSRDRVSRIQLEQFLAAPVVKEEAHE